MSGPSLSPRVGESMTVLDCGFHTIASSFQLQDFILFSSLISLSSFSTFYPLVLTIRVLLHPINHRLLLFL